MTEPDSVSVAADEVFRWRAGGEVAWLATARQVSLLLDEVAAGRMEASPAEELALRTFVATVEGMTAER